MARCCVGTLHQVKTINGKYLVKNAIMAHFSTHKMCDIYIGTGDSFNGNKIEVIYIPFHIFHFSNISFIPFPPLFLLSLGFGLRAMGIILQFQVFHTFQIGHIHSICFKRATFVKYVDNDEIIHNFKHFDSKLKTIYRQGNKHLLPVLKHYFCYSLFHIRDAY